MVTHTASKIDGRDISIDQSQETLSLRFRMVFSYTGISCFRFILVGLVGLICCLNCVSATFRRSQSSRLLWTPCFNLPLPGGRSISYNQETGVLRIQLEEQQQRQKQLSVGKDVVSKVTLDSIVVRDTKTVKGHGAYATANLSANTFLGLYEGTMIRSRESLEAKYSRSGTQKKINGMDYVLSLDGGVTFLDGSERAMNRSSFSPVHLNHADRETWQCNCIRELLQDNQVAFFTARDIIEGEELCFNYGNNFWKGREHLKQ